MAFTVEDGTGVVGANSLASVAFADAYHADRLTGTAWTAVGDAAAKQKLLVAATDYVVDLYAGALAGKLALVTQALPFPRYGFSIVPVGVKAAVVELALVSNTTPLLVNVGRGKKKVKVGPLEVEYDGNSAVQTFFVAASLKMAPYLTGYGVSRVMVPLVRC